MLITTKIEEMKDQVRTGAISE